MLAGEELLDTRGHVCPEPVRMVRARMATLSPGAVLQVLATDPATPIDLEAWCDVQGHVYLGDRAEAGVWIVRLRCCKD